VYSNCNCRLCGGGVCWRAYTHVMHQTGVMNTVWLEMLVHGMVLELSLPYFILLTSYIVCLGNPTSHCKPTKPRKTLVHCAAPAPTLHPPPPMPMLDLISSSTCYIVRGCNITNKCNHDHGQNSRDNQNITLTASSEP
jgi:hypothetical protein